MNASLLRIRRAGFTLIETVVVVALTALIMITLSFLIQYFYKTNAYALQQIEAINSARLSVENAVTDLREADYGADGSYPVAAAATSSVTFYANLDSSTTTIKKVRFYLDG